MSSKLSKWEAKGPLTTKELLATLEEDLDCENNESIDVVYVPPEPDEMTDEENIDENIIGEENLDTDIAGTYEIHTNRDNDFDSDDERPLSTIANCNKVKPKKAPKQKATTVPNWKKIDSTTYSTVPEAFNNRNIEHIISEHGGKSPLEIFFLFFDKEVIDNILRFSNTYASQNNRHDFHLTEENLKKFLGILILSGYHNLPQTDMYWSKDEDKEVRIVRECMSRNKFRSIKQNIHLSDNTLLNKGDKFAKLTPIFDIINKKCVQFGIFSEHLAIDERMVPYFGRHSCKMFIRGKPVRFGFKLWCLCSDTGYLFKFIPYGGKTDKSKNMGLLGSRVVLELLSVVEIPQQHKIFFDNFFTSFSLFKSLGEKGFFATGTVRDNRTAKCPLEDNKTMSKKPRGSHTSAFDSNLKVLATRWNDNSVVTVMTNFCNVLPLTQAKRYNRKERKETLINQPSVIHQYNQHMGGVDLHDNGIANYRISIRGKKWWWPLFTNVIDSMVVNSWKIFNIANESKISQLEYRSSLALSLLKYNGEAEDTNEASTSAKVSSSYGRPSKSALPGDITFDNIGHIIIREAKNARRKCRFCKSNTIYMCKKCNVHLHPDCFESFHIKI